jgi:cytochrome oxidase Cu insertion factor (SCO1/SenC/PrrC family)
MKSTVLILLAFAGSLSAQGPVPRPAEDIGIQTGQDKYVWLSDYSGKTRIVAFILTTCSHCQFTTGILNLIQKDYAARGVQVIESAIEPMSSLHIPDFQKKFTPAFPVGYNEQSYAAKFLGIGKNEPMFVPQIVMIDAKGVIRVQYNPDSPKLKEDVQEKTLREDLEKVIKEGQVAGSAPAR